MSGRRFYAAETWGTNSGIVHAWADFSRVCGGFGPSRSVFAVSEGDNWQDMAIVARDSGRRLCVRCFGKPHGVTE